MQPTPATNELATAPYVCRTVVDAEAFKQEFMVDNALLQNFDCYECCGTFVLRKIPLYVCTECSFTYQICRDCFDAQVPHPHKAFLKVDLSRSLRSYCALDACRRLFFVMEHHEVASASFGISVCAEFCSQKCLDIFKAESMQPYDSTEMRFPISSDAAGIVQVEYGGGTASNAPLGPITSVGSIFDRFFVPVFVYATTSVLTVIVDSISWPWQCALSSLGTVAAPHRSPWATWQARVRGAGGWQAAYRGFWSISTAHCFLWFSEALLDGSDVFRVLTPNCWPALTLRTYMPRFLRRLGVRVALHLVLDTVQDAAASLIMTGHTSRGVWSTAIAVARAAGWDGLARVVPLVVVGEALGILVEDAVSMAIRRPSQPSLAQYTAGEYLACLAPTAVFLPFRLATMRVLTARFLGAPPQSVGSAVVGMFAGPTAVPWRHVLHASVWKMAPPCLFSSLIQYYVARASGEWPKLD